MDVIKVEVLKPMLIGSVHYSPGDQAVLLGDRAHREIAEGRVVRWGFKPRARPTIVETAWVKLRTAMLVGDRHCAAGETVEMGAARAADEIARGNATAADEPATGLTATLDRVGAGSTRTRRPARLGA